jgi:hypothetical protein
MGVLEVRSKSQTALDWATVRDGLGEVAITSEVVLSELAIHEFAIDESSVWKASTRECTVPEVAADEVAPGEQTPITVDVLERTADEIWGHLSTFNRETLEIAELEVTFIPLDVSEILWIDPLWSHGPSFCDCCQDISSTATASFALSHVVLAHESSSRKVLVLYLRRPRQVVDSSVLCGRFRYSDLKEAARRVSLWVLYVIEQVRMICKVAIGGCVRQLHREKVRRRGMLGCWVEV